MAEVVGPGDLDSIPPHLFKISWYQTMRWSNGQEWILVPGEDFPSWMTFDQLHNRLLRNAGRAKCKLVAWPDDEGRVHLIMRRYGT
jgi:hypothetical protein